jgi:tRNA1Val (adenine37-N6)-methyltransferase
VLPGGFFAPEGKSLQFAADENVDLILDGRVKIVQRREGYRFTEDALHLCKFIRAMPKVMGIDLGTGCGIIAIVLVKEGKVERMVGLELQENLAALAKRNVALNGLGKQVEVQVGDIRAAEEMFAPGSFSLVVSNPPYRELGRGRLSPSLEKRVARHEWACSLEDVVRAAGYLLAPEGIFVFCHLKERWEDIQRLMEAERLKVQRKEIWDPAGRATNLLLVEAMRERQVTHPPTSAQWQ